MRKTIIGTLTGLLLACSAFAAPDIVQFTDKPIHTNLTATTAVTPDTDVTLSGWIDSVIVDVTGTVVSNTIVLSTAAGYGTGAARTLLTLTAVTADGVYPVRDITTDVAGADSGTLPARHALVGDRLRLVAYHSDATNISATVYVVLSPLP